MQEAYVQKQLQTLTDKLWRLVEQKRGDLADPVVLELSQEIDKLIVSIQRDRMPVCKS